MMAARSTCTAALAVAALGWSLTACGGGSSGLSSSALASKANAICTSINKKADAVPSPTDPTQGSQVTAYFDALLPIISSGQSQIAALKPDSDAKANWDAFVTAESKSLSLLKDVDAKARASDPNVLTYLKQQQPTIENTVKAAANKIKASDCAT